MLTENMLWAWNVVFVCNTESIFLCVSTSEAEPPPAAHYHFNHWPYPQRDMHAGRLLIFLPWLCASSGWTKFYIIYITHVTKSKHVTKAYRAFERQFLGIESATNRLVRYISTNVIVIVCCNSVEQYGVTHEWDASSSLAFDISIATVT